ncbi:MAG: glutamine--tRNA ligase/YqeY domain fusion protein [Candidatus Marinimicrobia bacterium]|nr:glutamine--tRNA ligase/YqeY domain fusion protein [Candidatus Neomarinimicrobiota bacterium]
MSDTQLTNNSGSDSESPEKPINFIEEIIQDHLRSGRFGQIVHTRFPPEPNGYLHIGHAKSIALNFSLAAKYGGMCNLRFDDTNPSKEEEEYVHSIKDDIKWLGFDWEDREYFASDYFEQLYEWAVKLIKDGHAYVCDLSPEKTREYRGTLSEPGKNSPYRDRSVAENLDLFGRMRQGEYSDGSRVLKAKIDMSHPNFNMRDPVMYRILHAHHHRTGNDWCIYPMYDFTHGQSDSIEKITQSICTLEFENHRPLYDWFCEKLGIHHPQQIEFARLNLTYTVMSKRKFLTLVNEGYVNGWDDPRMPTISGLRRRGYTPESIRKFCEYIGVAKNNSVVDVTILENQIREHLNAIAPRVMTVLRPLKVVIENYPVDQVEELQAINNPEDESAGSRGVSFTREIYIDKNDFMEVPVRRYFRLAPGKEVRLRYGYIIKCESVIKNDAGEIVELRCTYDPDTLGKQPIDRKVKGVIHWVSINHAIDAEIRIYDRLFTAEHPDQVEEDQDFRSNINPDSLEIIEDAKAEPSLADVVAGQRFQFERVGYFSVDPDSTPNKPVFNRIVSLRDTWAKIARKS